MAGTNLGRFTNGIDLFLSETQLRLTTRISGAASGVDRLMRDLLRGLRCMRLSGFVARALLFIISSALIGFVW